MIIWFCGSTSISKVNLKDLSFKEIKNVVESGGKGKDGIPMLVSMKIPLQQEIFLVYVYEDNFRITYINEEKSEIFRLKPETVLPTSMPI